jgi:hypothetical protein
MNDQFSNLENDINKGAEGFSEQLEKVMCILVKELGIEFGQVTLYVHHGKVSPRIEIQKRFVKNMKNS